MLVIPRTLLAVSLIAACSAHDEKAEPAQTKVLSVAALFAGPLDDGGFVEAGYRGLVSARDKLGVTIATKDSVKPEEQLLAAALRELAAAKPDLIIAHGGQNDAAAQQVAAEFPSISFVVTQGTVTGANLASYEVLQEQSAFLAGALAAWTTKTHVVGHMSGIRVKPGLKGRAAYANGVAYADPSVKLLTNFSGDQDDNELSKKIANRRSCLENQTGMG
jgi:basic membrane protein A and related proteins